MTLVSSVKQVGVIGAGLMGAEIALSFALAGSQVLLLDQNEEHLKKARQRLDGLLQSGVRRKFYDESLVALSLERIQPILDYDCLSQVDMVTEAVFESQDVKAEVFSRLDRACKPECLLASNTSTIPISNLGAMLPKSRRVYFIGTHYFSPVSRMKLVEVIPGMETSAATVERVLEICTSLGKTPIRVKDVAGFAVNRMLHAFIIEAIRLVDEGVASVDDLDIACRLGLGHPLGPFELMDIVTSKLCLQAQEIMYEAYGERFRPPALLKQRVRSGFVGGKGQPGWRPAK